MGYVDVIYEKLFKFQHLSPQQPFKLLFLGFKWMMAEMFIELSRLRYFVTGAPMDEYGDEDYSDKTKSPTKPPQTVSKAGPAKVYTREDEAYFALQYELDKNKTVTRYYPCDKKSELFVLQQDFILHNRGYSLDVETNGSR